MKNYTRAFLCCLVFLCSFSFLHATHNRAGEIVYFQTGDYTIQVWVITYTKASSVDADRDSLTLNWGDGTAETLARSNGLGMPPQGELLDNDTKKNIYIGVHTYSEWGDYTMYMTDPNRNLGVINIPNSINVRFHLETSFRLEALGGLGVNTSPILLEPPVDLAFAGEPYYHTPNGFDLDGDSIAYELVTPMFGPGMDVIDYTTLSEWPLSGNMSVTFNEETGLLIWDAPQLTGDYGIAYAVKSYRDGEEIGRVLRDIQITVIADNEAPELTVDGLTSEIIDVFVDDIVIVEMTGEDTGEEVQDITITSTSGLYENEYFDNTATFAADVSGSMGTATFEWVVQAEHVRDQPHQVVFKVKDDYMNSGSGASAVAVMRFRAKMVSDLEEREGREIRIQLFPNPVKETLFVQLDSPLKSPTFYQILNSSGQLITSGKLEAQAKEVDVRALPSGTYFLKILDTNKYLTFIKQ